MWPSERCHRVGSNPIEGRTKHLSVQKSHYNTLWFKFQTHICVCHNIVWSKFQPCIMCESSIETVLRQLRKDYVIVTENLMSPVLCLNSVLCLRSINYNHRYVWGWIHWLIISIVIFFVHIYSIVFRNVSCDLFVKLRH